MTRKHTTRTSAQVRQVIYDAVAELLGKNHGPITDEARDTLGDVFFANLHTAFMAKSQGGQDEFGDEWAELAQSTINQKTFGQFAREGRNVEWRKRHGELMGSLIAAGLTKQEARDKATELAWGPMVAKGGVSIGIDTNELETSLRPSGDPPGQVRDSQVDKLTLGTEVEHAKYFNGPRKIIPEPAKSKAWVKRGADVLVGILRNAVASRL